MSDARAQTAVRDVTWGSAARLIALFNSLIISVVAARVLGADGMGRQSYIAFVEISMVLLLTGGLPVALMRHVGECLGRGDAGAVKDLAAWGWRIAVVGAAAAVLLLVGVALWGGRPAPAWLLAAVVAAAAILHTIPSALLSAAQRWRDALIAGVTTGVVAMLATVAVLLAGGGITGMFAVEAAAAVATLLWTRRLARRWLGELPGPARPSADLRRRVGRYAAAALINVVLGFVVWRRSELFFLQRFAGDADIAIYSIAFAVAAALATLFAGVDAVTAPAAATLAGAGAHDTLASGYGRAARLVLLGTLPLAAIAAGIGPALLAVIYGAELAGAGPLLRIMLIALPLVPLTRTSSALLHGLGRQRVLLIAGGAAAVVDIALDLLLIPRFAATGAAIANTAAQLVLGAPVVWVAARAVGGIRLRWRTLAAVVIASAAAGGCGALIAGQHPGAFGVLAAGSAAMLVLILLSAPLGVFADDDVVWVTTAARGAARRLRRRSRWLAPAGTERDP